MKRPWLGLSAVVLSAGLAGGCMTANAIQNAQGSFARAKAAGAETKAPFEYHAARVYLDKAIHEAEEGDCKGADDFTRKSEGFSAKAIELSRGGGK